MDDEREEEPMEPENWPNAEYIGLMAEYRGPGHAYRADNGDWWFECERDGYLKTLAVGRDELKLEGEC